MQKQDKIIWPKITHSNDRDRNINFLMCNFGQFYVPQRDLFRDKVTE